MSTTFLGNGEYYTPLPRRQLSSGVVAPAQPSTDCLANAIQACGAQFSGPALRHCVYGAVAAAGMLPAGTAPASSKSTVFMVGNRLGARCINS